MKENKNELIRYIYRPKTIDKYNKKQKLLGFSNRNVNSFLYNRILLSFILFFILLALTNFNILISLIVTSLFYYLFSYFSYDYQINKRSKKLERDATDFFEILILSLESGNNLVNSLKITTENIENELSREFKISLKELEYGKSFHDAFSDLKNRIPSDTVQNIILSIIDSYTSGGNIIEILKNQIDFIQNKRMMDIKGTINKIPIKISVVSVFLFIPLVLLLILAPVLLEYFG